MTQTLPDTQDVNDVVFSQDTADDNWGILHAIRRNFVTLALTKCEYTAGRSPLCDVVLSKEVVERDDVLATLSKFHFKIVKGKDNVYLEDTSFNGTHVNEKKVGKGKRVSLQNNDQISMSHPWFKVFVYMKEGESESIASEYPEELRQKYSVSRILGSGACGDVRLAFVKETFARYAMKTYHSRILGKTQRNTLLNEVKILQKLKHPCIVSLCDVIHSPEKIFIFLELMEGGDLYQRIYSRGPYIEKDAKWIFYQIVSAVQYLHLQGIAHRDLKLENILLSSDDENAVVKVTDFGLSKVFNSQLVMKTLCGTPMYLAPEVIETHGCGAYTNKVDIWSIGIVLYACLSGRLPFSNDREDCTLYQQICNGDYSFPQRKWRGVSSCAIELIKSMMTVDPKRRLTTEEVISHQWLQDSELTEKIKNMRVEIKENEENEEPVMKRGRFAV